MGTDTSEITRWWHHTISNTETEFSNALSQARATCAMVVSEVHHM